MKGSPLFQFSPAGLRTAITAFVALLLALSGTAYGAGAKAGIAPARQIEEYNAEIPKTVVQLQEFRQTDSATIHCPNGNAGEVTLTNLNPMVNAWYLLWLSWDGGATKTVYHLENADPTGQQLRLDATAPSGLVITKDGHTSPCDLSLCDARNALDTVRASKSVYAPLCDASIYLRNPVRGHRTALETVTDILRDDVWGGEQLIEFVRDNITRDRYRNTAESVAGSRASPAETNGAGGTIASPAPAQIDSKDADRLVVPVNLGIDLDASAEKGVALGTWYPAKNHPGIFVSLIQPNMVAPEILQSYRKIVRDLDSVEASSLCYLIAFDLDRFELGYELGTEHPRVGWSPRALDQMKDDKLPGPDGIGTIYPLVATGFINPMDAGRTVATFTAGFKRSHGAFKYGPFALKNHGTHYGFLEDGVVLSKLQPGLATLVVYVDGSIQMKTWTEADNEQLARIKYARQNGVPLIEYDKASQSSKPGALVGLWGPGNWSGSEDEKLRTLRAGLALQETHEKRFLVYALFTSATPSAMTRVFQAYGCRYAMLLDMNALEHTYLAVYRREGAKIFAEHLVKGMSQLEKTVSGELVPRFLGYPDNRDFFYLMRRPVKAGKR